MSDGRLTTFSPEFPFPASNQPVFAEALPHDDELMTQPVPQVSCQQALAIAQQEYGLFGQMTLLQGERDLNFCLTVTPDERYMLKVINAAEPADVSDFQTSLLLHLASQAPALPVPRIRPTQEGLSEACIDIDGVPLRVRLVSYLPGTPQYLALPSLTLMQQLGGTLAQLDHALHGFTHPAANRSLLWDISRAAQVRPYLDFVAERQQYQHLLRIFDRYDHHVAPELATLRHQVIHNDLNPHNVLVDGTSPTRVTGIIDFGDAVFAPLICEVATALAYQIGDGTDLLEHVVPFVAAYHRRMPLTRDEIALLPDLIATRMALTLTIAQWRASRYPDNREYLLRNVPRSWHCLQRMVTYSHTQFVTRLQQVCAEKA
ncbi:phosphotransferase [Pectobacterium parmentieri]|uniref:Hydroxylysine kinase n=1 Tax=Pectobacterium parmentieri TaxID=1905730 RepID=A0A8B3FDW1_PECPM|nr:phosphotransferase [Pectobacterium parmentieri]AOR58446.1 phosphotransferase [Pectobacterium parmentieri]AYH10544.1 phosphotransferase [Pectobacterium parmentieri]AYH18745.1 phosphotransferase [Pectobacterium parmentieri]AYH36825.1 phosphotransferase [Pectobacterium parmentieri]AZS57057.1 phosphotransferase [Pectobacterium parmentieri]